MTTQRAPQDGSSNWPGFPPHVLREHAFIADGRRGALCGPRGDLVWLCTPRWDSPAVLSTLLGGEGIFAITPADANVWGGYYEPGTLIWRNRWTTTSTQLECREALAMPADPHRTTVLRRIEAIEQDATVRVVLDLRANFGAEPMHALVRDQNGIWTMQTGGLVARLTGAGAAEVRDRRLFFTITVPAGTRHDLALEISDRALGDPPEIDQLWANTEQAWRQAVPAFDHTIAPTDARHAYAVLLGLTTPDGGTVAAATLGLPERAEQGRNYDYRYVWIRDQAYVGIGAGVHQPTPLFHAAVDLATARILEHGPELAPAYRTDGTALPDETTLKLSGYPGGQDVVGNHANNQFQLDAVGETLQLLGAAAAADALPPFGHEAIKTAIDVIAQRWREPDAGIWELDNQWWTHSRLSCVSALRTTATHVPGQANRASALANVILTETTRRCTHPTGRWQRSPSDAGVDAALLLPPVRGSANATHRRTSKTISAVRSDLVEDGFVYRFVASDHLLGHDEGAFVLCGFMMSLAQWQRGDLVAAMHYFERSRTACGPAGLFAEEYDVQQRQLRGNMPQAFTHAMLLEAAQRLSTRPSRTGTDT